jgi:hypothetical protein
MQGVRGGVHLPPPAPKERMQGVRGGEHLPPPAHKEQMQGVRGGEHLPPPAHKEQMQGVRGLSVMRHLLRATRAREANLTHKSSSRANAIFEQTPTHHQGVDGHASSIYSIFRHAVCTLLLTLTGLRQRLPDPMPELPRDQRDLRYV